MKSRFYLILLILAALLTVTFNSCDSGDKDDDDNNNNSDLFADYFDNMTTYPEPATTTWVTEDGKTITAVVYPGQIVLFTKNAKAADVTTLVTQNNGTIVLQIPNVGFYVATVETAQTQPFLTAMYASAFVSHAFPNGPSQVRFTDLKATDLTELVSAKSTLGDGDANSIIQTVDAAVDVECGGLTHMEGVARVARAEGVEAHINDISKHPITRQPDLVEPYTKTAELIENAYNNDMPIVINLSLGGDDDVVGSNYFFMFDMCLLLESMLKYNPHILDNAVIYMAVTNNHSNATAELNALTQNNFPDSPIWNHLYFVGAEEGANGCGLGTDPGNGWVNNATANYMAAPSCNVPIPDSECKLTGNSFATPKISGLTAKTYELLQEMGQTFSMPEVAFQLNAYQGLHNGTLPSAQELANLMAGVVPAVSYDGTWSGTFNYTATIYHDNDPPEIINTSFILTMTLKSKVAVPGYPHLMKITGVTCSDPSFGATMVVLPDTTISMAFLPKEYGIASESGYGIIIQFPNGFNIGTNNGSNGTFTISADGNTLKSTPLVEDEAFSAGNIALSSNDPGSGPGGYAYNWCTFRNWTLTRQTRQVQ